MKRQDAVSSPRSTPAALEAREAWRRLAAAATVARVEQADALLREAAGATTPTLNAGAGASRARTSGNWPRRWS